MASLVLTVIGPDRPGLVETLSETLADYGANWLESRMARMEGRFAGLLHLSIADELAPELEQALAKLEPRGLRIAIQPTHSTSDPREARALRLDLVGHDRPGIVRHLSHALAERHVNVEELETSIVSAPMSGETLFRARAQLRVPPGLRLEELRETLEKIANELMIDLTVDQPD
jgi:glycine cleavage system regulatory protein